MSERYKAPIGSIWMMVGIGSAMLASKLMLDTAVRVHRAGRPARLLMGAGPFAMTGWMLNRMRTSNKVSVLPAEGRPAPERKRKLDAVEAELVTEPVPVVERVVEAVFETPVAPSVVETAAAPWVAETVAAALAEPLAVEADSMLEALQGPEPQPVEFEPDIIAEPQPPAGEGPRPTALAGPRAEGVDDLKRIKGIGPKLEIQLNELGYYHFDQIAAWGPEELAWIDENLQGFTGRATRDEWIAQATALAGGGLLN